jgi:hypothetical protein
MEQETLVKRQQYQHHGSVLSASMLTFLSTIDELETSAAISKNVHYLLKDLVRSKEPSFFDAVVVRRNDESHGIEHLHDIIAAKAEQVLESLYHNCSYEIAKTASINERVKKDMTQQNSLVYGEVEFASFIEIILNAIPTPLCRGGKFYDIGSGSGRAVYTARLVQDFDTCVGIELLPNLHELAVSVDSIYMETVKAKLPFSNVDFYCQDMLEHDWSDGNVVFAHSTCFEDSLLQSLFHKAKQLQPGSYFITFRATGIDTTAFELINEIRQEMSWGEADVFIFRRRAAAATPT